MKNFVLALLAVVLFVNVSEAGPFRHCRSHSASYQTQSSCTQQLQPVRNLVVRPVLGVVGTAGNVVTYPVRVFTGTPGVNFNVGGGCSSGNCSGR